jgi:hypothetical protein
MTRTAKPTAANAMAMMKRYLKGGAAFRAKNPRRKPTAKRHGPAHGYRGYGIARIQPGTSGFLQYLVSYTPKTWGKHSEALSFALQSVAKYAAENCGFRCAVVPLNQNRDTEVAKMLLGKP